MMNVFLCEGVRRCVCFLGLRDEYVDDGERQAEDARHGPEATVDPETCV